MAGDGGGRGQGRAAPPPQALRKVEAALEGRGRAGGARV